MPKFEVLKPTPSETYWFELASYVAPYATVGSFLITAGMAFLDHSDEDRHAEIMQKLAEISQQIENIRVSIENKIDETVLKERSSEVVGIKESLNEYKLLRAQGVLDNIISESAQIKHKINSYLDSPDVSAPYYLSYNALKCLLLPLRITCFGFYNIPKSNTQALIKDELRDLLRHRQKSVDMLRTIGMNRVSEGEVRLLLDEAGPTFETDMWVAVDGKSVWDEVLNPVSRHKEQHRIYNETRERIATETSKELVEFFEKAQAEYDSLP